MHSRYLPFAILLTLPAVAGHLPVAAQQVPAETKWFQVVSPSGSLMSLQIPDQTIRWTDLSIPGRMVEKPIRLAKIRQAVLCRDAAGSKISRIRDLLDDLKGDDYAAREAAEKLLMSPEIGKRFKSMLEAEQNHPSLETRYRIQRILSELAKRDDSGIGTFDRIQLTDGSWLHGDVGELVIESSYRGQMLILTRAQIASLTEITDRTSIFEKLPGAKTVEVVVSQRFDESWKSAQHTLIDFTTSPDGQLQATRTDLTRTYIPYGLHMKSERPGYVGISGYAFRSDCPPKDASICVFESVGNAFQRFKGIMDFTFCVPNQPGIPAGVFEFGLFVSRVDRPRDFILEAYNADGLQIGVVEASDAYCTFHGIRSSEPIYRVRLLSNPYLFSLDRKVDEDYCVDDLRFSPPVALPFVRGNLQSGVMTIDGDRLMGPFTISANKVRVQLLNSSSEIEISLNEVRSMVFANPPDATPKGSRVWHAMLKDRSIVEVDPSAEFKTDWFEEARIERSSIASLSLAPNGIRLPLAGDWKPEEESPIEATSPKSALLVFPTCRLRLSGFELGNSGYTWKQAEARVQDLWLRQGQPDPNENTLPNATEISFADTSPEQIPTLWLSQPPAWEPKLGSVRLTDGQQFTLSGNSQIEFVEINTDSIILRWQGRTQKIPIGRLASVDLPIIEAPR